MLPCEPLAGRTFATPVEGIPAQQSTSLTESALLVIGTNKAVPDPLVPCDNPFQQALGGKYRA